jgi:hypothetical protein
MDQPDLIDSGIIMPAMNIPVAVLPAHPRMRAPNGGGHFHPVTCTRGPVKSGTSGLREADAARSYKLIGGSGEAPWPVFAA